jgi:hypothetical protein
MRSSYVALGAISFILSFGLAGATESSVPVLVSPGLPSEFAVLAGPCPTFSWVGPTSGESQELAVYEVDESGNVVVEPTLTLRLPALASSWTPPAAECFGRGRSYAWSLRSVGDLEHGEWGEARFFSIPAGPSEEEFRAGLEVVKAYLALQESDRRGEGGAAGGPATVESDLAKITGNPASSEARIRTARAGVVSSFRVGPGGTVEAASFAGDGSALSNIGSASIAANAVGPSEIAANAVDADEILDGSVGSAEIATDAVGAAEIASGAVGSSEIQAGAVGSSEIASGAVGSTEMAGSFCLVKRGGFACPAGYTELSLTWDTEDTENADDCSESIAQWCGVSSAPSFIILAFCCA